MSRKQNDDADEIPRYTMEQLRAIVAAGMSVTEAKMLLEDGYSPSDVLELAGLRAEASKQQAADAQTATAKAMQKAMRPENEHHPGISAFSRPGGDLAAPKGDLPFEFWYLNYPCHKFPETEHYAEWDLMAQVKPGTYTVIRKDGTPMAVEVKGEQDANGKLTKVEVIFTVSRENKWTVPPKSVVLYQIAHAGTKPPKRLFVEAMNEWLTVTLGEEAFAG